MRKSDRMNTHTIKFLTPLSSFLVISKAKPKKRCTRTVAAPTS